MAVVVVVVIRAVEREKERERKTLGKSHSIQREREKQKTRRRRRRLFGLSLAVPLAARRPSVRQPFLDVFQRVSRVARFGEQGVHDEDDDDWIHKKRALQFDFFLNVRPTKKRIILKRRVFNGFTTKKVLLLLLG